MITVVGSLNMDLVIHCKEVPKRGQTIIGGGFGTFPGGKGANQAVAAARLNGKVMMIGCVGDDIFGRDLVENLRRENIDISAVRKVSGVSTGVAVITVDGDGDNSIILDSGANFRLTTDDIDRNIESIKKSKVLLTQLEIPIPVIKKSLEIACRNNVTTILNPAPAAKLDDEIYKMVDIITPNETECEYLTGIAVKDTASAQKAADCLLAKGVRNVVITAGSKGVYYNKGKNVINKGVPKVKVVDTTAAGDSFSGALAVSILNGMDLDAAIDFCNIVGTLTVMKEGAQVSLPTLEQVNEWKHVNK